MVTTCNIVPFMMHTIDELQNRLRCHIITTKSANEQPKLCPSATHFPHPLHLMPSSTAYVSNG
uniref:Uncharacterized protein n=1 Tax=Zea mays TaxID=4577 RepID=C4J7G3_MAIZE|nr:unknown [Zea mays]